MRNRSESSGSSRSPEKKRTKKGQESDDEEGKGRSSEDKTEGRSKKIHDRMTEVVAKQMPGVDSEKGLFSFQFFQCLYEFNEILQRIEHVSDDITINEAIEMICSNLIYLPR